jgi:hypothetical protein
VYPREAVLAQLAHHEWLTAEAELSSRRARRGEKAQLRERKTPLLETAQQFDAYGAGGSYYGYDGCGACGLLVQRALSMKWPDAT